MRPSSELAIFRESVRPLQSITRTGSRLDRGPAPRRPLADLDRNFRLFCAQPRMPGPRTWGSWIFPAPRRRARRLPPPRASGAGAACGRDAMAGRACKDRLRGRASIRPAWAIAWASASGAAALPCCVGAGWFPLSLSDLSGTITHPRPVWAGAPDEPTRHAIAARNQSHRTQSLSWSPGECGSRLNDSASKSLASRNCGEPRRRAHSEQDRWARNAPSRSSADPAAEGISLSPPETLRLRTMPFTTLPPPAPGHRPLAAVPVDRAASLSRRTQTRWPVLLHQPPQLFSHCTRSKVVKRDPHDGQ